MIKTTPSLQDYLKTLLELSPSGEPIRSVDISRALGYSKASVSKAMSILRKAGHIQKEKYGAILLTEQGRQAARSIKHRNDLVVAFLTDILGVDWAMAREDACRMEHAISPRTAECLERYLSEQNGCSV